MERTISKRLVEEVMRIATLPLDLEEDLIPAEEPSYETVDPESIESLMEFTTAETLYETHEFIESIKDLLDSLTPREAKVLKLRFGIGVDREYTLDEVGKHFDVTRERIRQIEAKALRKMRHPSRSDRLKAHLAPDQIRTSAAPEPFPDIENFWGVDGMLRYHDAVEGWNIRRLAAKMKIEKLKVELKKGTLV